MIKKKEINHQHQEWKREHQYTSYRLWKGNMGKLWTAVSNQRKVHGRHNLWEPLSNKRVTCTCTWIWSSNPPNTCTHIRCTYSISTLNAFTGELYQTFMKKVPILHKVLQKSKLKEISNSFYKSSIILTPKLDTFQENYRQQISRIDTDANFP